MRRRCSRGFTLVETLVALLVVGLLTGAISVGIRTAVSVRDEMRFVSESEILASTLHTTAGDVLRYAVNISGEHDPAFQNEAYGIEGASYGQLLVGKDESDPTLYGRIYLTNALLADHTTGDLLLLGSGVYTDLVVQNWQLTYDNELFTGAYTIASRNGKLTKDFTFVFRPVNA